MSFPGRKCLILGWGTYKGSYRPCISQTYSFHEVDIVDQQKCADYYGTHMIKKGIICVKARNSTVQECLGDTGGIVMCKWRHPC